MARLRRVSGRDAVRSLQRLGFAPLRQRGSHLTMKKVTPDGEVGCVVPMHDELAIGTLRGILHQARVSADDFMANL